jgi:hypothetical protein
MPDKLIRVEFVDAATQKIFGVNESPPDLLPETFVLNTKVSIKDQDWQVVKAEPMTRAEYVRSGKLTLTLSKIMMMPVKDILYTLPTIYDALPAMQDAPLPSDDDNVFLIHADFWRCVEFVPTSYRDGIEKECLGIANIHQHHREGMGFNKMYVRTKPATPMAGLLRLSELQALFQGSHVFEELAFWNEPGRAQNTFAFRYGMWVMYGDHDGESVQSLAIGPKPEAAWLPLDPFLTLMRIYDLYLVDWINANPMTYQEASVFLKQFHQQ